MKRRYHLMLAVLILLLLPAAVVRATPFGMEDLFADPGIIVDRQPLNTGGLGADTLATISGSPYWERTADDILLTSAQTAEPIRRITWWGFYNLNNPPATETMRIRFYGARGDGLPDDNNIIFEESFLNPSRTATGRRVGVGVGPDELIFQVDLPAPLHLSADTPYWVEIAQIGDIDSLFRWEFSGLSSVGLALINPNTNDWKFSLDADNALQLSTIPEPATSLLVISGLILVCWHRRIHKRYS